MNSVSKKKPRRRDGKKERKKEVSFSNDGSGRLLSLLVKEDLENNSFFFHLLPLKERERKSGRGWGGGGGRELGNRGRRERVGGGR